MYTFVTLVAYGHLPDGLGHGLPDEFDTCEHGSTCTFVHKTVGAIWSSLRWDNFCSHTDNMGESHFRPSSHTETDPIDLASVSQLNSKPTYMPQRMSLNLDSFWIIKQICGETISSLIQHILSYKILSSYLKTNRTQLIWQVDYKSIHLLTYNYHDTDYEDRFCR